jgi:hypothetical protein
MRPRTNARWGRVGVLVLASALAVILVPLATGTSGPSPSPIPQGCQLRSPQPEAPLKLNLVAVKRLAKVVVAEKEIFNCFDDQSTLARIKEVNTIIETTEQATLRGKTPSVATVATTVDAETCTEDLKTGRISCATSHVPLAATSTPLAGCSPTKGTYPFDAVQQPSHPTEMSSVSIASAFVKTVQVDKAVFDCAGRVGDLYLLSERVEAVNGETGFRPLGATSTGVMCKKNETTAEVVGCALFGPRGSA